MAPAAESQQPLWKRILILLSQRTDLALAVLIFAIIFMMILPLPTQLIDTLIAFNMSMAVILLMVAVYLPSPLEFSAFPAVLLVSTLFRLALSISTTRMILLQADAGEIIFTFGNFVVGGNLVVGIVVFLILTIVQFVVITKGAERVSEVSARFSLDAMPGKQMSIDGDMRAGLIDMEEARIRRSRVEKESQLFGAMDGAMKFVKGDAIAGIIIVGVNLIGGIAVGVLQRGLTVDEALHTYSILTIGDGLINQIPGLFIAITAGLVVTRVTSEDSRDLSSDIIGQVVNRPRALAIAAVLMLGFGLIPGFPTIIFVFIAAALGFPVWYKMYMNYREKSKQSKKLGETSGMRAAISKGEQKSRMDSSDNFSLTVPLLIDVSERVQDGIDADLLNDKLVDTRRALYMELGVPFPGIKLRFTGNVEEGEYSILLQEVPMSSGRLRVDFLFVRDSEENLKIFDLPYETERNFLPSLPTIWVAAEHKEALHNAKISVMEPAEILIYHLGFILKRHAESFIGIQETYFLLERMESEFGDLVKEVQRVLPVQKVADILKRLVSEEISIRNLRNIMEALIEWGQHEKDSVVLTEYIRTNLARQISYKFSGGQNIIPAYLLDSEIEEKIRGAIRQTSGGSYLSLEPAITHQIVNAIKNIVGDLQEHSQNPVLVAPTDIRRYVRKLIELELYELPVIAYQELTQEMTIQPLAQITLNDANKSSP